MTNTFIDENEANQFSAAIANLDRQAEEQQFAAQDELEAATNETLNLGRRRPVAARKQAPSAGEEYAADRAAQIARYHQIAGSVFDSAMQNCEPAPVTKTLPMY